MFATQAQDAHQETTLLAESAHCVEFDELTNTWIATKKVSSTAQAKNTTQSDGSQNNSAAVTQKENATSSDTTESKISNKGYYARFQSKDNCVVDLAGLTVKVIKEEPILTNIHIGQESLVFDIHDNNLTNKIQFFVKTETEETTKSQTSAQIKSDYPCKYTFVYDASRSTLNMYQNNVKNMSVTITTPGYFGIIPTVTNTIFTLNPFRTCYPNLGNSSMANSVLIELAEPANIDIEAAKKEISDKLGARASFTLHHISEDRKYVLGLVSYPDSNPLNLPQGKDTFYFGNLEKLKTKLDQKPDALRFVEEKYPIFNQGLTSLKKLESEQAQPSQTQRYDTKIFTEEDENRDLMHIPTTDSLLVSTSTSLKLLKRREGKFTLPVSAFAPLVTSPEQKVVLELARTDAGFLFQSITSAALNFDFASTEVRTCCHEILNSLSTQYLQGYETLLLVFPQGVLTKAIHSMISAFVDYLNLNRKIITPESKTVIPKVQVSNKEEEEENHQAMSLLFGEAGHPDQGSKVSKENKKEIQLAEDNKTKTYFSIRVLLELAEQIKAKTDPTSGAYGICLGQGYSTHFRLASFCLSRGVGRSFIELANNGIYNAYNTLNTLTHFQNEDRPLSGLDSGDQLQSSVFEVLAANGVDTCGSASQLNVPLGVFVNSQPAVTFASKILSISHAGNGKVLVSCEDGTISLYDTQTSLVRLYQGSIFDEEHKKVAKSAIVEKKAANTSFVPTGNFTEKVFEAIIENKKDIAVENPDKIEPDPAKLEQLYQMGFSLVLSKKALIKTKNQSLDMAVEVLFEMQGGGENEEDNQILQEAISLIKPEWHCDVCQFDNNTSEMEQKDICEVCKEPAPLSAYYTKEQIDMLNSTQAEAIQQDMQLQAALLASQKEAENAQAAASEGVKGKLFDIKLGTLNTNFLSRMVVVAAFKGQTESSIRVRRVGYSCEYLRKLTHEEVEGSLALTTIKIGNEVLLDSDSSKVEKVQGEIFSSQANIQVDSLIPQFCIQTSSMASMDQKDINIQGSILGIQVGSTSRLSKQDGTSAEKESKDIYVLVDNNGLKLIKFEVRCKLYDFFEPSTEVVQISEVSIEGSPSNQSTYLLLRPSSVAVLNNGRLSTYSPDTLQLASTFDTKVTSPSHLKITQRGIYSYSDESHEIKQIENSKSSPTKETAEKEDPLITCKDILDFIHHKKHVKFSVEAPPQCSVILKGNPESASTLEATVVAPKQQSLKLKLKPSEGVVKNGILSLNLTFSPSSVISSTGKQPATPNLETGKGGAVSINILDQSEEDNFIPLNVVHQSFADTNANYLIGQCLFGNSAFYLGVTKKGDLNYLILDSQYELDLLVKTLTLVSKPKDTSDIVESALVFTTNFTGQVSNFDLSCLGNLALYKEWVSKKITSLEKWEETEPVAFADLLSTSKTITSLDFVRKAKYICIVFKLSDGKKPNFALNFVGVHGSTYHSSSSAAIDTARITSENLETELKVQISSKSNLLGTKNVFLPKKDDKYSSTSVCNINIYEEISDLDIDLTLDASSPYTLDSVSLKLIKCGSNSDKNLKEFFEKPEKLVDLIKQQSERLTTPTVSLDEKRQILCMFNDIVSTLNPNLIKEVHSSINVEYLVGELILKSRDREALAQVSSLFERFNQQDGFANRVKAALATALKNLSQTETNLDSLKNFFKLLEVSMMNSDFSELTQTLRNTVLDAILALQKTNSRENKFLRSIGIETSPLDQSVFWNLGSSKKGSIKSEEFNDYIPMETLVSRSATQIDVFCDLRSVVSLDRLLVKFTNISKYSHDIFSFLSVYKVDLPEGSWQHPSKTLLFTRPISQSFALFTNKSARQPGLNFYNGQDYYNCIGYKLSAITGRYFLVRLSFDSSKQSKQTYKISSHVIQPLFYGAAAQGEKAEANLPNTPICTNAVLTKGEVEVRKISLKEPTPTTTEADKKKHIEASMADTLDESKSPTAKTDNTTPGSSSGENILRECLANIKNEKPTAEEMALINELCEGLATLREKSANQNSIGSESYNFWLSIVDFAGINKELLKIELGLGLDHFKSLLENVIAIESPTRIQDIAIKIMSSSLEKEKAESAFNILKKLILYFASPDSLPVGSRSKLLPVIYKIFSVNKSLDTFDLINHTLSKVCKKFDQNQEICITQIAIIFELLMLFSAEEKSFPEKPTRVPDAVNNIFKIILWVYEQNDIPIQAKNILTDKAVKLLQNIFKKYQSDLEKNYVPDLLVIEILLIRSLHLNTFKGLTKTLKSISSLNQPAGSGLSLTKSMLTIYSSILNQLISYMKSDSTPTKLSTIIGKSTLANGVALEFLSYLINTCGTLGKQVGGKSSDEKKEDEAKAPTRKREKLTAEEAVVQRSLSVNSQNLEKAEDEFIPSSIVKDLLSIYGAQLKAKSSSPTLLVEISKLIISKNPSRDLLKNTIDLYSIHSQEEKTLLTNELMQILQETVESLKTGKTAEEDNAPLRDLCSNVLDILAELISNTGLDKLDSEVVKLIISFQELVFGPESKKGLAAVYKTLITSLSKTCITNILFLSAKELDRVCNWGGPDGYDSLEKSRIPLLEILSNFFYIVTVATSSTKTPILNDMVSNLKSVNEQQVSECIYRLLDWSVFNNLTTQKKSPAVDRLVKICTCVDAIFKSLAENAEAGKIIISRMFNIVQDVHSALIPKINSGEIGFIGLNFVYNLFTVFEKTMELTLTDSHMINYFITECNGVHYIFDLLNLTYENPEENTTQVTASPTQGLVSLLQKLNFEEPAPPEAAKVVAVAGATTTPVKPGTAPLEQKMMQMLATPKPTPVAVSAASPQPVTLSATSTATAQAQPAPGSKDFKNNLPWLNPDKFSEEFAKEMVCQNKINGKEEKTTDWQKNKKSGGKPIFLYPMNNDFTKNNQELICDFALPSPIDLRTIKAGCMLQYNEYGNKVIAEPSYIHIHYRRSESEPWRYLCDLDRYEDNGYYQTTTACYQNNFMRTIGDGISTRIESVCLPRKVQYLRFLFGKPQVSFQENYSTIKAKDYNVMTVAPTFISILGILSNQYSIQAHCNNLKETTLLKLLHRIFSKDPKTLDAVTIQAALIDKFKVIFSRLVEDYVDQLITPITAFSRRNQDFGVWVMTQLLDLKYKEEHAKVVGEIVLSTVEQYQSRVALLCQFIIKEIQEEVAGKRPQHSDRLYNFMAVFSSCIHRPPQELKSPAPYELPVGEPEINMLVACFSNMSFVQQFKNFFITLVHLPNPAFKLGIANAMDYLMVKLCSDIQEGNFVLAELLSLVAISKKVYADRILEENIVDLLFRKLPTLDGKKLVSVLLFFRNIINHEACLKKCIELKLPELIFVQMKNAQSKKQEQSPKSQSMMILGLDIIKYVISTDNSSAKLFCDSLIEQLNTLMTDNSADAAQLIETVFIPILYTVKTSKVFFERKFQSRVLQGFDDQPGKIEAGNGFKLKSQYLGTEYVPTLLSNVDMLLDASMSEKFKTGHWEMVCSTESSGSEVFKSIEDNLLGQGPFIVLIDGEAGNLQYTLGIFCSSPLPKDPKFSFGGRDITIANSDNHFIFLYERSGKQTTCHYRTKSSNETETFLRYSDKSDASERGIAVFYVNMEKLYISFTDLAASHIDLFPMKCLETDPQPNFEFPFDFHIKKGVEIWKLTQPQNDSSKEGKGPSMFSMGRLDLKNELLNISYSYYRNSTVYNLPSTLTLDALKKPMFADEAIKFKFLSTQQPAEGSHTIEELAKENKPIDELGILDLEFNKDQEPKEPTLTLLHNLYTPQIPTLDLFIANQGIDLLLKVCTQKINTSPFWTDKPSKNNWLQIINEIKYFSKLNNSVTASGTTEDGEREKNFLSIFGWDQESVQTLLKIASNSQIADKALATSEEAMVASIYDSVVKLFKDNKSSEVRLLAIKEDIFSTILSRLELISKETKRTFVPKVEVIAETNESKDKDKDKDKKSDAKSTKRKGVGYESGGNSTNWSTEEHFKANEQKNKKIKALLNIILNILDGENWVAPPETFNIVVESCLLCLIENAFRCTSLLDMAKEKELYELYLNICSAISKVDSLIPALLKLDEQYKPPQITSIEKLLSQLHKSSVHFKNLSAVDGKDKVDDNTKAAFALAEEIIKTYEQVQRAIARSNYADAGGAIDVEAIKALPMEEKYKVLLENHRFGYVNMKDPANPNQYIHYWKSNFAAKYAPQPTKIVRLAQEIADISSSLPIDSTNAMFVRADEERLDVMKAIIFGAEGCPYAHGAFEYHIYFDNEYPNGPPKVNLETTGGGDVRFNPNLYNCGKVCLSLLGTWRGNASENWDPKLSTLSQVLISIQAVVMSEEVYFNEPGYGQEAGTDMGELKNVGYSNIVRLCNIKYAMIGQMENPTKGFENVIRTHFILKKEKILETVRKWKKWSLKKEANYTGLVNDHNSNYCERFKNNSSAYADELAAAITKLEATFDKLEMPPIEELLSTKLGSLKMGKEKKEKIALTDGQGKIDDIDMTYDENVQLKSMTQDEAGVKDRWSRYIGVMGMESVAKQANASVFISGLNSLGVEVAKNIVLSGAKRITLQDHRTTTWSDLAGQFFLGEADIGKNRAEACIKKIQQLNFYVKVDQAKSEELPDNEAALQAYDLKDYEVIVLVDASRPSIEAVSKICRANNRSLIVADCHGVFSRVFCDFGPKFACFDKNGEEAQEVMISSITNEENGKVTLLEGVKHTFEDGDTIVLRNVEGMKLIAGEGAPKEGEELPESINGLLLKVKVLNFNSFTIGDTRKFEKYIRGGLAKQVKIPFDIEFKPYHEVYPTAKPIFEPNLEFHDFMKVDHPRVLHLAFLALDEFFAKEKRRPNAYSLDDATALYQIAVKKLAELGDDFIKLSEKEAILKKLIARFALTQGGNFGPQSAFIGGIVCQEIVKAITGKFKPIVQTMYADSIEILDDALFPENIFEQTTEQYSELLKAEGVTAKNERDDGIRILLGQKILDKVKHTRLFMVGSGAIGCELLKNYAMIGLGTGKGETEAFKQAGQIILTDPDVIEVSNLNRQFLFREKHLRKPKSVTAAAAAQMMNPQLQGRLLARLDKVHEGTSNIFTDQFFEELTIVTNALDNIQARKYIDSRCVAARTPLIESGTLGPKGHVQVIIPNKTESYGSMKDPVEELDIPHCTLKMFPEETLHCVEWARDLFGNLFVQGPQALRKSLEDMKENTLAAQELKALKDSLKLAQTAPTTFEECVKYAREKFQEYYNYDIKQLIYVYPLDHKDKDGNPFWKLPKRPPTPTEFDPKDSLHREFITAMAALRAKIFNIPLPADLRTEASKQKYADMAAQIKMPDFVPSDEKAKEISKDVEKQGNKPKTEEMAEKPPAEEEVFQDDTFDSIKKQFIKSAATLQSDNIRPEEFEKDDDKNFHIDVIHSMANLRSRNYKLDEMDWITVKIKAGRIVPALATTTASIAGLQTLEVVKVLKEIKVEDIKNAFLNIAVPILTQSEPAAAPKIELIQGLTVTLWDRWEIKDCKDKTLFDVFAHIEKEYKVFPRDVFQGAKSIYMRAMPNEKVLHVKLAELFQAAPGEHEDLTIVCSKSETDKNALQGIPMVRLYF